MATIHTPANRAAEGDMAVFFPSIEELSVQSCLAMTKTNAIRMRIALFNGPKSKTVCFTSRLLSIEPTALIKSQPDCCVFTEKEEFQEMLKRLSKKF